MAQVYSMLTASGKLEEIKPIENGLPIGCIVYGYGYAMSESIGAIISEPNEYGVQKGVYIAGEEGFFNIDKYARPHSKKFGIGNYYDDDFKILEADKIEEAVNAAKAYELQVIADEEAKKQADDSEKSALPKKYPHLTVNYSDDQTTTKKNIIATLKKFWPAVKFSVRKDYHRTYRISWVDGPSTEEVETETRCFESYKTDETGDFRDPAPSNFNNVFGGVEYLFTSREMSPETEALKPGFIEMYGEQSHYGEAENIFYRVFRKTSMPAGAAPVAIVEKENANGSVEELYQFTFNHVAEPATEVKETVFEKVETAPGEVAIIDYSEKAIAVVGDTKPIKDQLKELGGKFNFRLSCGAGWIFPKSKLSDIQNLLTA